MQKVFDTINAAQTGKLGEMLSQELRGGEIICLSGELGSGKTTFAQGVLKGLGVKGPYTSPTFVVLKHYNLKSQISKSKNLKNYKLRTKNYKLCSIYHIDAYRVNAKDILDLGWEEIISSKNNIVIVEWAEKIKPIIPRRAIWLKFEHIESSKRRISVK